MIFCFTVFFIFTKTFLHYNFNKYLILLKVYINLKEIKNIFKNSKYFSKIQIDDDFEINGTITLMIK